MNYEDRITKEYVEGLIAGMPRVAYGRYTGNGSKTHSLQFDFTPKFVAIIGGANGSSAVSAGFSVVSEAGGYWASVMTGGGGVTNLSGATGTYSLQNNVLTITTVGDNYSHNYNGGTYYYFAIG